MRFACAGAAVLAIGCSAAWSQVVVTRAEACLNARTAVMRLDAIAGTIESCTAVINDKSQPISVHADATAQRGILYARRWRLTDLAQDAHSGIADISEGLRFNLFKDDKKHQLLIWRGELFEATRQTAKAADDFRAVLRIAPLDEIARAALRRLDAPTN
jgi:hypothetical protein